MVYMKSSFITTAAVVVGGLQFGVARTCPDRNSVVEGVESQCMQARFSALNNGQASLQCTAGDASASLVPGSPLQTCQLTTDTLKVPATLTVTQNANTILDIGLWIALGDEDNAVAPASAQGDVNCDIFMFPCDSESHDDGDHCGDSSETGGPTTFNVLLEVPCTNFDTNVATLDIHYCFSWDNGPAGQNAQPNDVCSSTADIVPGTVSKCTCGTVSLPAGGSGDPHLVGFKGQKFDFTGASGESYALLVDGPSTALTMQVYAPIPELEVVTYITGVGLAAEDTDGVVHNIEIRVDEPADFFAHHECPTTEPCLADGVLVVTLDGEPMSGPGVANLGPGVSVSAINIPGECRPFGFENYWAEKVRLAELASAGGGRRRLEAVVRDMQRWIVDDSSATDAAECAKYAERAVADGTLFTHQGEHASFQIVTPELTLRLNHGRLHQVAMRDPTDQYDLPDHRTYQMNLAIERAVLSPSAQGVLGGTIIPTKDADGKAIMEGFDAFPGTENDYHVSGPFDTDFALYHQDVTNVM